MLRVSLAAAVLAAVFAVPAHADPTVLMPGVTYDRQLVLSRFGPEVVHIVTAPRPGGLYTVAPVLSNEALLGRETLTSMQKRLTTTGTSVGIDGDTSSTDGVPSGVLIQSGVLSATTNVKRSSIGFDAAGTMRIERVGLNATWQGNGQRRAVVVNRRPGALGATLYTPAWGTTTPSEPGSAEAVLPTLGAVAPGGVHTAAVTELRSGGLTPIPPGGAVLVARGTTAQRLTAEAPVGTPVTFRLVMNPDWSTIVNGLGGGPLLVRDGKAIFNAHEDFSAAVLAGRTARAAVGQKADGTVVLVVVDGGLPGFSVGMTNFELAQTLAKQGVTVGAALESGKATPSPSTASCSTGRRPPSAGLGDARRHLRGRLRASARVRAAVPERRRRRRERRPSSTASRARRPSRSASSTRSARTGYGPWPSRRPSTASAPSFRKMS